MTCDIESFATLEAEIEIIDGDKTYTFSPDEHGRLSKLSLTWPVERPELFTSSLRPDPPLLQGGMDTDLLNAMKERAQALESHLAFRASVTRVRWDAALWELVFETDEERSQQALYSIYVDRAADIRPLQKVSARKLENAIEACARFPLMNTILAFVREGNNDFHQRRFITAFYNFFFVLEGLYAEGKHDPAAAERAFSASPIFTQAANTAVNTLRQKRPKSLAAIAPQLRSYQRVQTSRAVARLLIKTRGHVHHFFDRRQNEPTPFASDRFEHVCTLARIVAILCVTQEMIEVARMEEPQNL